MPLGHPPASMLPWSTRQQGLPALGICPRFPPSTLRGAFLQAPRPERCKEPQLGCPEARGMGFALSVCPRSPRSKQTINQRGDPLQCLRALGWHIEPMPVSLAPDLIDYCNEFIKKVYRPYPPPSNPCIGRWAGHKNAASHESFNGTLRAECFDVDWFASIAEAKNNSSRDGRGNTMRVVLTGLLESKRRASSPVSSLLRAN